jgi:hypothetical protein
MHRHRTRSGSPASPNIWTAEGWLSQLAYYHFALEQNVESRMRGKGVNPPALASPSMNHVLQRLVDFTMYEPIFEPLRLCRSISIRRNF